MPDRRVESPAHLIFGYKFKKNFAKSQSQIHKKPYKYLPLYT